ncbi:MAG: hypothetical protein ACYDEP_02535 [Acidimicrobiales bacterium]
MSVLHEFAADGKAAYWEILTDIEQHLRWAFQRAHSAVSAELFPSEQRPVLDPVTQETLLTTLLLGDLDDNNGMVSRLIERCLTPKKFQRVDPEKYVVTALFSASETAIRRRIADPHIGRKIRRFANANEDLDDLEALVSEYVTAYPKDRLSTKRAEAALTVDQRVPRTVPLDERVVHG